MRTSLLNRRPRLLRSAGIPLVALALLASVVVAPPASASTSSAASATEGLNYVALGDSYSAGSGNAGPTGEPVVGCRQAAGNYPHQVAAALGMNLTDVSCSGATTADVIGGPQNTGAGIAARQIDALSLDTDVVSITIGGNDLGFEAIVTSCVALTPWGPLVADRSQDNCVQDPRAGEVLPALRTRVQPALAATFAAIREAAPNARIFVLGYPSIAPDAANTRAGGCFSYLGTRNSFPFTNADVPALHLVEQRLDSAIQTETERAGLTYVPTFSNSLEHTACAPAGSAYINGITVLLGRPLAVAPHALHPNAVGARYMAAMLSAEVTAAFPGVNPR